MRDKLIELLGQVQESGFDYPADIERYTPRFPQNEEVADHLINNGVTIRERGEWITPWVMKPYGKAYGTPYCSVCKQIDERKGSFCPNCGADLR